MDTEHSEDIWSRWLLERRFGGDRRVMEMALRYLYAWRDKILEYAQLQGGETLLDVGCGDGLVGFGALDQAPTCRVIFSDISQELLDQTRTIAQETGTSHRCEFLQARAEDLAALPDASVDVVTTRSVLIFVSEKQRAFDEFYRVLGEGGRISLFEPINTYFYPLPEHCFGSVPGFDVTPVLELARKVRAVYEQAQPLENDPMMDFDEKDLLAFAERAGFREIHLELDVHIMPPPDTDKVGWEVYYRMAPNPKAPTLEEAVKAALTEEQAETFIAHLRPLVENNQGTTRLAMAYLWAVK